MPEQFAWDGEKDRILRVTRGFGFADIVTAIEDGGLLDDVDHPSPKYPGQRILYVAVQGYAVAVPYVKDEETMFLKTAFPDRRANKRYLGTES